MYRKYLLLISVILCRMDASAQQDAATAYDKLTELTAMFHGTAPYSCLAIVEVQYPGKSGRIIRDTSKLIYKNGSTYYKSRLVERLEGPQGELIINHELKTATLQVSDSVKLALQRELAIKPDKEFEALLDADFERKDEAAFRNYVINSCKVNWDKTEEMEEISIRPLNEKGAVFLSMRIRFNKISRVTYYEYTNREAYAKDPDGNNIFRRVSTIYDGFSYENVPDIPATLNDYLAWDGWSVELKKYTNYKFSLL